MSLKGKVAIVTGGARGIGAEIVRTLAAQGASVAFNYVSPSSAAHAKDLAASIASTGGTAHPIHCDVSDLSAPHILITQTLTAFSTKTIDILVNNAGIAQNTSLSEVTVPEYDSIFTINVRSVILLTQAILPYLPTSGGGRIVNISSISARGGYATQSIYAASKAAVEALTRVWATELGQRYGVTVNAVNPGPVDTEMYRTAGEVHLARMEEENKKVPAAARCGTTRDVADIVGFLCEERARWISGDVVCANGGLLYM